MPGKSRAKTRIGSPPESIFNTEEAMLRPALSYPRYNKLHEPFKQCNWARRKREFVKGFQSFAGSFSGRCLC